MYQTTISPRLSLHSLKNSSARDKNFPVVLINSPLFGRRQIFSSCLPSSVVIIYENHVERRTPADGKRAMIKGPSDEEKRLNYNEETLLNENEEDDAPDEPRWKRKITVTISSHCVSFEGTSHDKSVRRSGCEMEKLSLFVAWKTSADGCGSVKREKYPFAFI